MRSCSMKAAVLSAVWWTPATCSLGSHSQMGPHRTCLGKCVKSTFAWGPMHCVQWKEAPVQVSLTHLQFDHNALHDFFAELVNEANKLCFVNGFTGFVKAIVPACFLNDGVSVQLHVLVVDRWKVFAIIIRTIKIMQKPLVKLVESWQLTFILLPKLPT